MIDLRGSTDPEIGAVAQVLTAVDAVAREVGVDYLVVGATALNILSIGLMKQTPHRGTRDIDIAVAVGSWSHFDRLAGRLDRRPGGGAHSFVVGGAEVDVVPYGGVEDEDRTILWPDDHRMSVLGFREAVRSAETVHLPGGGPVRVPSIAALALLKLLAWADRRLTTTRDAVDLGVLVRWYSMGDRLDRLYDDHLDVVVRYDFDQCLAGAWLIGSDMSALVDAPARTTIGGIVGSDEVLARLAADSRQAFPRPLELMRAVRAGLTEGGQRVVRSRVV